MDRPENIPDDAQWDEAQECWEAGPVTDGKKHGNFKEWRSDGTLQANYRYHSGVKQGAYRRFHQDGTVSQKGSYKDNELHGANEWIRSSQKTTEIFLTQADSAVWRAIIQFDAGQEISTRFFSKSDDRVLADGTSFPEHPKGVPSLAEYDISEDLWKHGQKNDQGLEHGLYMSWLKDGTLIEECEYRNGKREGACKKYSSSGDLIEEGYYSENAKNGTWKTFDPETNKLKLQADYAEGVYHGSVIEYGPDGRSQVKAEYETGLKNGSYIARVDKEKYQGGTIRIENGQFKNDHAVGRWKLLDKSAKPVITVDFGVPRSSEASMMNSVVLSDTNESPSFWATKTRELIDSRMMGEALVAKARQAAVEGNAEFLLQVFDESTAPLSSVNAEAVADSAMQSEETPLSSAFNALLQGGDASRLLHFIAARLQEQNKLIASIDLSNAALLVSPDNTSAIALRAINHICLGEKEKALLDVAELESANAVEAPLYRGYITTLFPTFAFWPTDTSLPKKAPPEDYPIVRELDEVTRAIHVSANRLKSLRDALLEKLSTIMLWLPPDPFPLLSKDPLTLDEHEKVRTTELSIPELLTGIRVEWASLCWLCWSVGNLRVALPNIINPHVHFRTVVDQTNRQLNSVRQLLASEDVDDDVVWQGFSLRNSGRKLQVIAERELVAITAIFDWLRDSSNGSPWPIEALDE